MNKLYKKVCLFCILMFAFTFFACAAGTDENTQSVSTSNKKVLVAYFSATGNTKTVAQKIANITGGDLFEITPVTPYTSDDLNYNNSNSRANIEQNNSLSRPAISSGVENMDDYDIVFIGHPIWWGEEPRIIDTFVESYDFTGKTLVNFCTSGGSGVSTSTRNLRNMVPKSTWLDGHRFSSRDSQNTIQTWIDGLNIL